MGLGGDKSDYNFFEMLNDPAGFFAPGGLLGGPLPPIEPPKPPREVSGSEMAKKALENQQQQKKKLLAKAGVGATQKTGNSGLGAVKDENLGQNTLLGQ